MNVECSSELFELAERITAVVPCAERVRLLKTGVRYLPYAEEPR